MIFYAFNAKIAEYILYLLKQIKSPWAIILNSSQNYLNCKPFVLCMKEVENIFLLKKLKKKDSIAN